MPHLNSLLSSLMLQAALTSSLFMVIPNHSTTPTDQMALPTMQMGEVWEICWNGCTM